jgi:triosephosphate isomerase
VSAPLRPLLAGNWKMHHGPAETARFFSEFLALWAPRGDRSVAFFPPALSFAAAREAVRGRADILRGVQNVHDQPSGAFTGELSAAMAAEAGARLVLVGHSERRWVFGETIAQTAAKLRAVLAAGMSPVLCVGEQIEERRGGRAEAVVAAQLAPVLDGLGLEQARSLVVAYEPVWAIGTGVNATPADAGAMHAFVRERLVEHFGGESGAGVPILYGGSVKEQNAAELLAVPQVDGVLVGGASLDPRGFAAICGAA